MNNIKVNDINMKYYLMQVNKKYPKELTEKNINELLIINKDKLLKDFLSELFNKKLYKYLDVFYIDLFSKINLYDSSKFAGKKIN